MNAQARQKIRLDDPVRSDGRAKSQRQRGGVQHIDHEGRVDLFVRMVLVDRQRDDHVAQERGPGQPSETKYPDADKIASASADSGTMRK